MIGALFTGISGLSSQQKALDNESNNIANVNTVGFKASRISFADQMYQDRIGKGSKILDAEKIYTQGSMKTTGVAYDMALKGEGFFTVKHSNTNENLFTRAGNFRMGDNGTLQDAAGNEVQGWMMVDIDPSKDVTSTNPNTNVFTNDYNKLLASKVVKHSTYVETITAKATDYNATAMNDSETVFAGAGLKTKSAKVSDVEEAIKDYTTWLQRLSEEPDGASATSIAQISEINFKTGDDGLVTKEGDQIYAFIDGTKISQNYIPTTATTEQMQALYDHDQSLASADQFGFADPAGTLSEAEQSAYDIAVSRIETYRALADQISEVPGLVAYVAKEINSSEVGAQYDAFDEKDKYELSTKIEDMYYGQIQIKSLIPGREFNISEVAEVSGNSVVQGNYQTSTSAQAGSGIGALNSSKEALSKLITGNQRDVYTETDLGLDVGTQDFTYGITIYDNELGANIPIPNDGATPPQQLNIYIDGATSIDDVVAAINDPTSPTFYADGTISGVENSLPNYLVAKNVNGALVLETKDSNYDVEFSGVLKYASTIVDQPSISTTSAAANVSTVINSAQNTANYTMTVDGYTVSFTSDATATTAEISAGLAAAINAAASAGNIDSGISADGATTAGTVAIDFSGSTAGTGTVSSALMDLQGTYIPKDVNNNHSGRSGAGAEFIQMVTKVDQTASKGSLQLRLDTLGISDSAYGEFSVDSSGLITMKQDGADFAIGQVAIAVFNNNRGLEPVGDNLLAKTTESGEAYYNLNNDKTATVEGQTLELSNADLSESLVNLMVFQRAFEANAKSITTSDTLLNTLINLKR